MQFERLRVVVCEILSPRTPGYACQWVS